MPAQVVVPGGVFLRASDPEALYQWYEKHFGLERSGGCFIFETDSKQQAQPGPFVLSFFAKDNNYFDPAQPAMLNFRVVDLDALLASLASSGASIDPKREDYEYGRFAWITDPEGNRIELWQEAAS
jgi:predicted enzyme related to lactoylglutathione lyase